ncbi:MAG: hypothetical protein RR140_02075 [Clostridia bacterium]
MKSEKNSFFKKICKKALLAFCVLTCGILLCSCGNIGVKLSATTKSVNNFYWDNAKNFFEIYGYAANAQSPSATSANGILKFKEEINGFKFITQIISAITTSENETSSTPIMFSYDGNWNLANPSGPASFGKQKLTVTKQTNSEKEPASVEYLVKDLDAPTNTKTYEIKKIEDKFEVIVVGESSYKIYVDFNKNKSYLKISVTKTETKNQPKIQSVYEFATTASGNVFARLYSVKFDANNALDHTVVIELKTTPTNSFATLSEVFEVPLPLDFLKLDISAFARENPKATFNFEYKI